MRILIPDIIPKDEHDRIANCTGDSVISLKIIVKENLLRKRLRSLLSRLPYVIAQRFSRLVKPKQKCEFFANGALVTKPLKDIEVLLVTWQIDKLMFEGLLNYLPNLKWVHSTKTGVDHLVSERLIKKNIVLTNSRGVHSGRIAEFVMALMLSFSKKLTLHLKLQQKHHWQNLQSVELHGKTIGIIGMGSVGTEIAKRAKAFGMNVVGLAYKPKKSQFGKVYGKDNLLEVLKCSNFVVLCLPLTPETKNLISEQELKVMKKTAYLINVGRGETISEQSLIHTLRSKKIAGAALDTVCGGYVLRNHPFYSLNNVLLTHHSSYASSTSLLEIFKRFQENLKYFHTGKKLQGIVNLKKGY